MPIGDWQFWVVTIIALLAMYVLYRVLIPRKKGKPTNLTVSAKKHDGQNKCGNDCGCS